MLASSLNQDAATKALFKYTGVPACTPCSDGHYTTTTNAEKCLAHECSKGSISNPEDKNKTTVCVIAQSEGGKLSGGEIAGIAAGGVVAVGALAAGVHYCALSKPPGGPSDAAATLL